jgi:hypothetical protein
MEKTLTLLRRAAPAAAFACLASRQAQAENPGRDDGIEQAIMLFLIGLAAALALGIALMFSANRALKIIGRILAGIVGLIVLMFLLFIAR